MTNGYQKSVQALIKKIQVVAILVAVIIVAGVVFSSISKWKISEEEELTSLVSEKIVFTPPLELTDAIEGVPYEHSFCRPESARSGATCGGLAGATTNPYGGKPPYSFSHQFGVGFLPTGLALELNGLLRGTPTLPGEYTFGVCVTDLYEEVCKTTSLTVKPKSEQLEEQLGEEVSSSVKIESATAIPTRCYKGIQGESTGCECTVEISGTATLPVTEGEAGVWYGDSFPLSILDEDPLTSKRFSWATVVGSITCPNWYSNGTSRCIRTRDQSATGKWSITFTNRFDPNGSESYFAVVYSDLRWEPIGVWDSVTLTCQP